MPSRLLPDLNDYLVSSTTREEADEIYRASDMYRTGRTNSGISAEEHAEIDAYIQSMHQGGASIDEISQATNIPPTKVVESLNRQPKGRATVDPPDIRTTVRDLSTPTPDRPAPLDIPAATGIESVVTDDDRTDMGQLVDQGFSVTDIASDMLASMDPDPMATMAPRLELIDPSDYGQELLIVETLEELGTDISKRDAEALDNAESGDTRTATELKLASVAGAAALLENDPTDLDARETLDAEAQMLQILSGSGLKDNEKLATQLEMYKNAGELFFNTDDLADFIPKPDQALPFLVAGASLIQSGEKGESWGSALAKALSSYSLTGYKERAAYQNKLLDLKLKEKQAIQGFVSQMYMADRAHQLSLAKSLYDSDRKLYKIEGSDQPVALSDIDLAFAMGEDSTFVVEGLWTADHGKMSDYTLVDSNGLMVVRGFTETEALTQKESGKWADVLAGDHTQNMKMYNVGGVNKMLTVAEAAKQEQGGAKIYPALMNEMLEAFDTETGMNTWITRDQYEDQQTSGTGRYIPTDENMAFAHDENGELVVGSPSFVTGMIGTQGASRQLQAFDTQYSAAIMNRDRVLSGVDRLTNIVTEGEMTFGVGGALTNLGARAINEWSQIERVRREQGVNFLETDASGAPTGQTFTYDEYLTKIDPTLNGMLKGRSGQFLVDAGLSNLQAKNLMFQLALSSAMLEGQKGRDISDKDIERHLMRTGANATSPTQLLTLLKDLEYSALEYPKLMLSSRIRTDVQRMKNPDGEGTVRLFEHHYGNWEEESGDNDYSPTPGGPTISERWEGGQIRGRLIVDPVDPAQVMVGTGVLEGGEALSGIGDQTVHQVYSELEALAQPNVTLADNPQQRGRLSQIRLDLKNAIFGSDKARMTDDELKESMPTQYQDYQLQMMKIYNYIRLKNPHWNLAGNP